MNLLALPDDLWISVLHEWIGEPIILCALDIALGNYLLREQYLTCWLGESYAFGIFSNVHFKITHEHFGKLEPNGFFDWCEKRNIYPSSISCSHNISDTKEKISVGKLSRKALITMKYTERFRYHYKFDNTGASPSLNVLNECSQLKHLVVNMDSTYYTSGSLSFNCEKAPFPLLSLDLQAIRLYLSIENFKNLIRACPMLEMVKFRNCSGVHLNHVTYLLNHAKRIRSILIGFLIALEDDVQTMEELLVKESDCKIDNVSLKSLSLLNLRNTVVSREGVVFISCLTRKLFSILRRCPMQEELVLDFHEVKMDASIAAAEWSEVIATSCRHLQSFSLYNTNRMRGRYLMDPIYRYCGNQLKTMALYGDVHLDAITTICNTFTALESLKLITADSLSDEYSAILQQFQQAKFRDTLHIFKFNIRLIYMSLADCSKLFDCFPALKVIAIILSQNVNFRTPFAAIHLIEEFKLTGSGFEVSHLPSIMKRFVMLRKLTLQFMSVNTTLLCCMLTLPNLQYFIGEQFLRRTNSWNRYDKKYIVPTIQLSC